MAFPEQSNTEIFDYEQNIARDFLPYGKYSRAIFCILIRYLEKQTITDLRQKMVFVGGPRQVGKTTMAQQILEGLNGEYLNWDIPAHRDQILRVQLPDSDFWVFDELHKYDRWHDFLKALFGKFGKDRKILVTGSARLDYYRFSGDSLQGRYHYLRLHPFSVRELEIGDEKNLTRLWNRGGFPEPYLADTAIDAKRWSAGVPQALGQRGGQKSRKYQKFRLARTARHTASEVGWIDLVNQCIARGFRG